MNSTINRREALKRSALIMGGVLSTSVIAGVLKGCTTKPGIDWVPTFFTKEQATLVTQVAGIIIPKTETPGAIEVGVPAFIEQIVRDCYTDEEKERFMSGLTSFDNAAKEKHGDSFNELKEEAQVSFTYDVHNTSIAESKSENKPKDYKRPFILMIKELTMVGFFTSQAGAEQVLQYQAVPGKYNGCITLEEAGGKTWA
jgi:gluconate 2-dehydrogenase gamma chain